MKSANQVVKSAVESADQVPSFKNQALVRLFICLFMGIYYSGFGFSTHPLYIGFALYSFFVLWRSKRMRQVRPMDIVLCVIVDNGFSIFGLFATGKTGTFLLFFLIHISFGYGIRFGFRYLVLSLALANAGLTWLCIRSEAWGGDFHFFISFLLGMPFISLYIYYLTHRIRLSELAVRAQDEALRKLTSFILHDLRTPLSAILGSLDALLDGARSQDEFQRIRRLIHMVSTLGNLLSKSIDHRLSPVSTHQETKGVVSIAQWMVDSVEAFRDLIEAQRGSLSISLHPSAAELYTPYYLDINRVVLNALSNASRFCEDGSVHVNILPSSPDAPLRQSIQISNQWSPSESWLISADEKLSSLGDQLFGSGLGNLSAKAVIDAIGGTYSSLPSGERSWTTFFEFPALEVPPHSALETRPPTILLRPGRVDSSDSVLNDTPHHEVYVWSSLESLGEYSKENPDVPWTALVDGAFRDRVAGILANRPKFALVVDLEESNCDPEMRITGSHVKIVGVGSVKSWKPWATLCDQLHDLAIKKSFRLSRLLHGATVLVVEDEDLTRHMHVRQFKALGAEVRSAASLTQAAALIQDQRVEILVSDWFVGENVLEDFLGPIFLSKVSSLRCVIIITGHPIGSFSTHASSVPILSVPKPLTRESLEMLADRLQEKIPQTLWEPPKMTGAPLLDSDVIRDIVESLGSPIEVRTVLRRFIDESEGGLLTVFDESLSENIREKARHKLIGAAQMLGADAMVHALQEVDTRQGHGGAMELKIFSSATLEIWRYTKAHLLAYVYSIEG